MNSSKYDFVLKFTILATSTVKDKYTKPFSFILDVGKKSVRTIGTPAPIGLNYHRHWGDQVNGPHPPIVAPHPKRLIFFSNFFFIFYNETFSPYDLGR